jgi:hypothetical protein
MRRGSALIEPRMSASGQNAPQRYDLFSYFSEFCNYLTSDSSNRKQPQMFIINSVNEIGF